LSLTVNGQIRTMVVEPRMTLDALREEPALTATKKGCDRGERGACTVHVEGRRVLSCMSLAVMHEGKRITTIKDWSGTASSARSRRRSSSTTVSNAGSVRPGRSCRASR
jgi:xanthine dehydrogenase YagT iron-sulfur-binding subunit